MKIKSSLRLIAACIVLATTSQAQNQSGIDSTGVPGDNFCLQAAVALFKKAASPEEFEKMLNAENNHVNNLDLNEDGDIDYIRVIDNSEKDAHAFALQAVVSEKESQDIAVIEIEKTGDETAVLQIVGDEDIYGTEVIVEPTGEQNNDNVFLGLDVENSVVHGPNAENMNSAEMGIIVNVWFWPSVRFIYGPMYRPWISPWRWSYYPMGWRPWKPMRWHVWHPYRRPYYSGYNVVHVHRVGYAHRIYKPHRVTSVTVRTKHARTVGNYRVSRTKTVGPRGHVRTKTTVSGPRGNKKVVIKKRRH
ncbi:MAG TPA: hypothetical protein PK504_01430 [Ferruginibacter sp.]|nr:hypothetical protein [Ferruginibacter sp.]HRE64360.1 hypothetical protein [Ferruginibacter sp.]